MAHPGKVPSLEAHGYNYWKTRMKAYLLSQGTDIWDICQLVTFRVLPVTERVTPLLIAQHEHNNKAVNILFSGLGPVEFERVSHLGTAHEIWSVLKSHHEGTDAVKARLVETYRREYENFTQKPGESVDDLFGRFQSIINKIRVNTTGALPYTDHQQALKLLYALDRKIWEIKVSTIIESAGYDTLTVAELFSKLKATEVDNQLRSDLNGSGSKSLALATTPGDSGANPPHSFSFSALMSITEDQLMMLGDDELCLVSNRFRRAYDNRMSRRQGEKPKCFECGESGHFIAECPNKQNNYYKKGKHNFRDSSKHHHTKYRSGKNIKKGVKKLFKDTRRREAAFLADLVGSSCSSSSSSSSSSSDEEIAIKKGKKKDQGGPAGLCFVSSKRKHMRKPVCSMALEDENDDNSGSNSSSDGEVTPTEAEMIEMLEENSRAIRVRDELLEKAVKKKKKLEAKLADALSEVERLKSRSAVSEELECPTCQCLVVDLSELRAKHARRVEEFDALSAELESTRVELEKARAPVVSDVDECETCPHLLVDIAELKVKCEGQLKELNRVRAELEEMRARPILLGACKVCPTLRAELEQLKADLETLSAPSSTCESCLTLRTLLVDRDATIRRFEKSAIPDPDVGCNSCAIQTVLMDDLKEDMRKVEVENNYLREVLSWISAREPQLGMIIQQFRRGEETVGLGYAKPKTGAGFPYGKIGECSSPVQSDGVYHDPPVHPPKKQFWTPKPKQYKSNLDHILPEPRVGQKQKPKTNPPKATQSSPKSPERKPQPPPKRPVYHCEFCHRDGHLEEFCFRRKRVERRARAWENEDQFYQGGRQVPPRRGERRDARARRVGGGRGGGFRDRAPVGGGFAGQNHGRFQDGYGPRDRGFVREFERPRFGGRGYSQQGLRDDFFDFGYPSFEQMARHWFNSFCSNPGAGPFAHPYDR